VKDVLDGLDDVRMHNVPDVVKVHLTHNTRTRDTPHVVPNLQDTHLLIQNNVVGKRHAEVLRPCEKKKQQQNKVNFNYKEKQSKYK
jgi:hypothetical protein